MYLNTSVICKFIYKAEARNELYNAIYNYFFGLVLERLDLFCTLRMKNILTLEKRWFVKFYKIIFKLNLGALV